MRNALIKHACMALLALLLVVLTALPVLAQPMLDTRIFINVPSRTLWLYSGDTVVRSYPVGVGKIDFPTPEGRFTINNMMENPGWENPFRRPGRRHQIDPGSRSPLGTRWMGFHEIDIGEYGIHGTNAPSSVGQFSTHGCVRMHMEDAEDLYSRIGVGTPVEINYDPVVVTANDGKVELTVYPTFFGKGKGPGLADLKSLITQRLPQARIDESILAQALHDPAQQPRQIGMIPDPNGADAVVTFKLRISN